MAAIAQAQNAPQSQGQQYERASMGNNDPDTTVDVAEEEGTHAVAPSEEVSLDNDNIPAIAPNAPQQNTTEADAIQQSLDTQTKKTLIVIGIAGVVMVIVVIIVANVIGTQETEESGRRVDGIGSSCGCDPVEQTTLYSYGQYGDPDTVCGQSLPTTSKYYGDSCPNLCELYYDDYDISRVYYVQNTSDSTVGTCYCYAVYHDTSSCFYAKSVYQLRMWEYECCEDGRPYRIQSIGLHSDVTYIDCEDYSYHDDDEWKAFIEVTKANDSMNMAMVSHWKRQALSEHTSIATFAKFSLELMSIGAPLWLMELSNQAALDEIKHAQISFDVANMYLGGPQCIVSSIFPQHEIQMDADWNVISKDAAIGGCIGETVAAFRMVEKAQYGNVIDGYLYEMAEDEIKHAALAWITVKWMMDNAPNGIDLDVARKEWWSDVILRATSDADVVGSVVSSILNQMWMDCKDYHALYQLIIEELQLRLNAMNCVQ
eukprot:55827_1